MDFGFTKEQEIFRLDVRSFLEKELSPELRSHYEEWAWGRTPDEGLTSCIREFGLKLGSNGWLGMSWPRRYGGQDGSVTQEFIFIEELAREGLIIPNYTAVLMVGPTILHYGTEQQKAKYIPQITRGQIEFALGYTEPQAGSDLASLKLQAVEKDNSYILNGQKTFNTACHYADYHWLAVKTDLEAPKHKGISLFIVDLKSPGITIRPLHAMDGGLTNEVFYDDVEVPKDNLVGEKNQGFFYAMTALNFERLMFYHTAELLPVLQELIEYAKKTQRGQDSLARQKLAEMAIEIEIGRLLSYRVMWMLDQGYNLSYESAMAKTFNTQVSQHMFSVGMQILGLNSLLGRESKWAQFGGLMQQGYLSTVLLTFGGGSNELMRNIIATAGLGLPRQ
ncbi:acyl-CoA dehydrogenase family protein [Chloroflexota bacterium]